MKKKIDEFVQENKVRAVEFQKKYAVEKAAEVIKLFEKLAETDVKIDMKRLRRNVLANLVEQNRDKESNEAYWSYQLLMKLGVVPDPNAVE